MLILILCLAVCLCVCVRTTEKNQLTDLIVYAERENARLIA